LPGALHFVTGATINRLPVFRRVDYCTEFFDALAEVCRDWPCKLIAYVVIVPDCCRDHFLTTYLSISAWKRAVRAPLGTDRRKHQLVVSPTDEAG